MQAKITTMNISPTPKPKTDRKTAPVDQDIAKRFTFFIANYVKDTQKEIAKKTRLQQAAISRMQAGKTPIGFAVTKSFIECYNMNAKWLATGDKNEHPVSKPAPETGGQLGRSMKELNAEVRDLRATVTQMEKAIAILEAKQNFFIKRIEETPRQQGK